MFRIEFYTEKFASANVCSHPWSVARGLKNWHVQTVYALVDIFVQNLTPNNFYLKLFFRWCIFLAALNPKLNVICHFCTILYFNHISLSIALVSLQGRDRHMHLRTFLYEIQFRTTFIWGFFSGDAYFWQR